MAESIKDKAAQAGHKIAEGVKKAADWVKEKAHFGADKGACDTAKMACTSEKQTAKIREHMDVIASCGKHVGVVDHVEGNSVKLTKSDPTAAGNHHFIPLEWVATVDQHVHLNKNSEEVFRNWKAEHAGCCAG